MKHAQNFLLTGKYFMAGVAMVTLLSAGVATAHEADFDEFHGDRDRGAASGDYSGTCHARYANQNAAPCTMALYVDHHNRVTIPGDANCISPTNFFGVLKGRQANLRAPGWNAQPKGQTLELIFQPLGHSWTASGSGRGIADGKWTYTCNFTRR